MSKVLETAEARETRLARKRRYQRACLTVESLEAREKRLARMRENLRKKKAANPEKFLAQKRETARKMRKANPEKYRAQQREEKRKRRELNPERIRAQVRRLAGLPEPTRPEPTHCECCGRPRGAKALCLEHDHTTNLFRGWACNPCNMLLAMLGDNYEQMYARIPQLVRYLNRADLT